MWYLDLNFLSEKDSESPIWQRVVPLVSEKYNPGALAHHSATVYNSSVFIIGGIKSDGTSSKEIFKYDVARNTWQVCIQKGHLPGARDDHTCLLYNDEIILFGGYESGIRSNDLLRYKISTGVWTQQEFKGKVPCPRAGHSAVIKGDQLVIFAGTNEENQRLKDTWVYDFRFNTWEMI
jgi:N-acetylneuraminic acid mutarotase